MDVAPELAVVFPHCGSGGGVERVTKQVVQAQAALRTTRFVGATSDDPGLPMVAVHPARVPCTFAPLAFRRAAARTLHELAPATTVSMGVECPPGDVLWVHSVHAAWLAGGGDVYLRGRRVPSTLRMLLPRHQVLLRLEQTYFTGRRPRAVICTSQQEVDDLATHYDVPRELMHVVPNGYDATQFSPERRTALRDGMRARIGAAPDDIVVLMVANEWHRKGLAVLLEAVARTGDRRLRVDLVGGRAPAPYLPLAARLGLADRLHWHGPSDDVARFYAAADVFALPTTYEPFGLVIVEAMASGLPVITSALAGAADAITPGVDGALLDDPRDVDALAEHLRRLGDAGVRHDLGAAALVAARPYEDTRVMARADRILFPDDRAGGSR